MGSVHTSGQTQTEHANKYLLQLCKHWSHKAETTSLPNSGTIEFSTGERVELSAMGNVLKMVVSANSASELEEFVETVETHIRRFAFREDLLFEWEN